MLKFYGRVEEGGIFIMSEKIWKYIEKNCINIFYIIITILSLIIRYSVIKIHNGDYTGCLEPWFNELLENGGFKALNRPIGNYNMPYLTILAFLTYLPIKSMISIKAVSIIFDYVCAIAVVKIARMIIKDESKKDFISVILYGIVLFLPTVVLNSAWWGQCDSIYVGFMLISILFLMKKEYLKSFIFLGISFSFKLQFIFILPLYILVYMSERKFPLYYFLIIPITNLVMCLPSIFFGKSIYDCFNIYINQAKDNDVYMSMNFSNIYNIIFKSDDNCAFSTTPNEVNILFIGFTIFIFIILAFLVIYKKTKFDNQKIIEFGLLSIMICTFLLPHMHERYLYAGDILGILYFLYNKDKLYVPLGILFISTFCYAKALFNTKTIPLPYGSVLFLVLIVLVFVDIIKKYFISKSEDIVEKKEPLLLDTTHENRF